MPTRVLWVSDSPHLPTGFGRVTCEIVKRLARRPELDVHVLTVAGGEGANAELAAVCTVWPHEQDSIQVDEFARVVEMTRPEVVVTHGAIWNFPYAAQPPPGCKYDWIGYFPLEAGPLPTFCHTLLERMSRCVVTSEYSAEVVRQGFPYITVEVIKHGVDTTHFHPGPSTLGKYRLPSGCDAFIVGCVARNQPRKGFPILIDAFSRFAGKHDDARLYLHTWPTDPMGWDLADLARRHGMTDRVLFTRAMLQFEAVSDADLANIYRAFDVFALPTMGEGFGIPILEAMACGIPVAATAGSAVTELLDGRGELIPAIATVVSPPYNQELAVADTNALVDALERLYSSPELRLRLGSLGAEFARTLTWDRAADDWAALIVGSADRETHLPVEDVWQRMPWQQTNTQGNAEPVVPLLMQPREIIANTDDGAVRRPKPE